MEEKHRQKIEKLMEELECPRDFVCYKQHPEHILKAQGSSYSMFTLECFQKRDIHCQFVLGYGYTYYCRCPTVSKIAKTLNE